MPSADKLTMDQPLGLVLAALRATAARFWAEALGRPIDPNHPGSRGNYRMLETPPGELSVQIQRVEHESRVHLD